MCSFLNRSFGDFTFVPVCLGANRYDYCEEIATPSPCHCCRRRTDGILA